MSRTATAGLERIDSVQADDIIGSWLSGLTVGWRRVGEIEETASCDSCVNLGFHNLDSERDYYVECISAA